MARVSLDQGGLGEGLCLLLTSLFWAGRYITDCPQCGVGKVLKIFFALTLLYGQYRLFFSAARCFHCVC